MQPTQRSTSIALGAILIVVVGALVWKSARSNVEQTVLARMDAGATASALAAPDVRQPSLEESLLTALSEDAGNAGNAQPGLPTGAPKNVRFGVILVQYRGAQGAAPGARSKEEAWGLARSIAEAAKLDFKAAVSRGDPGSIEDAGRMPRGVLEPSAEYALFSLSAGAVSDPVDTPRGFWIARRIE